MYLISDQQYEKNIEKISDHTPYENSVILFKDFFQNKNSNKTYYPFFMRYPMGGLDFFSAVDPVYREQMKQNLIRPLIIMVMDSYDLFSHNDILKRSSYQLIINNFKKNNIKEENISFIINNKNIEKEIAEIGLEKIKAKFYHFDYFLQLLSGKCYGFEKETHFEKHFVSLANGQPRHHRFGLTFGLYKNDLMKYGRVSCCGWDNFFYKTEGYKIDHAPYGMMTDDYLTKFKFYQDSDDLKKFIKQLPFIIDNEINLYNDPESEQNIFKKAFINIVNETHFPNKQVFTTEKTFRSIIHGKPFIVNGDPGILYYLKELGFKTFGEFWDESYDSIDNDWDRIQSILGVLKGITAMDLRQCYEMYEKMLPILEHNYNLIKRIDQYKNLQNLF